MSSDTSNTFTKNFIIRLRLVCLLRLFSRLPKTPIQSALTPPKNRVSSSPLYPLCLFHSLKNHLIGFHFFFFGFLVWVFLFFVLSVYGCGYGEVVFFFLGFCVCLWGWCGFVCLLVGSPTVYYPTPLTSVVFVANSLSFHPSPSSFSCREPLACVFAASYASPAPKSFFSFPVCIDRDSDDESVYSLFIDSDAGLTAQLLPPACFLFFTPCQTCCDAKLPSECA